MGPTVQQMSHFNGLTAAEAERLALLAEELGEAAQVIGKILRHGYASVDPTKCGNPAGNPSNRQLLIRELGDIEAVVALLAENRDISIHDVQSAAVAKNERMGRYLHHNKPVTDSALLQLSPYANVIGEIVSERDRSRMHGEKFASLHEAYAVILEELDEVWDITRLKKRDRNVDELRKELIQLGAMALKALGSLDNFVGGTV